MIRLLVWLLISLAGRPLFQSAAYFVDHNLPQADRGGQASAVPYNAMTGLAREAPKWHDSRMAAVVHRKRALQVRPPSLLAPDVVLRTYCGDKDIAIWLRLREQAFARQKVGVRQWDADDFRRELVEKPWWRSDWMWFAETTLGEVIGTVTLAIRQSAVAAIPVVHWLCVLPKWRRRGIGKLLLNTLEQAAWDAGYREVALETHEAWREAAAAYNAMGYEIIGPDPAS